MGEVCQALIGYEKKGWKVTAPQSNAVSIQLTEACELSGLSYIPLQKEVQQIVKGTVKVSDDGKIWRTLESFEFGNLKNDPTRRFHHFKQPVRAAFVRIDANLPIGEEVKEFELF